MRTAIAILLTACTVQAETIIKRVDFKADNDKTQVMVSVDLFNLWDLCSKPQTHMEFDFDSDLTFAQADPDAETIARLLERYGQQPEQSTHWSRNAGRYKTAAIIASIGTAVAYIVAESKESSGRDQSITAGGNVNFNTGTVGGDNGNNQAAEAEFEGIE